METIGDTATEKALMSEKVFAVEQISIGGDDAVIIV